MEIQKLALHHIDVAGNNVESIDIDFNKENIITYIEALIEEIIDNPNKRQYNFNDGETQVKSSIYKLVDSDDEIDEVLENNAKRLLKKQRETDEQLKKKNLDVRVQKGSLIQIHFKEQENNNVLICKVEHDEIINEKSLDLNRGLNTKKKVFKAFLIFLENDERHQEIYLNDKNNSKYWWNDFLELEQLNSDEENTSKSVDKIISTITGSAKKTSYKLDSTILRNNVIGYFRNNQNFNFTDLLSNVFNNYTPYNDSFPIDKIKEKLNNLIDDLSFDKQFKIIPKKIGKKKNNSIKVAPGLFLSIEDYVKNLDTILKPYSEAGVNGMTIISDEAFNFVKDVERDN